MKHRISVWVAAALGLALLLGGLAEVRAERPQAPYLLPEKTLGLIRVRDTKVLGERFQQTAIGRILEDEQIKPLVGDVSASLQNAWKQIEEQVGLPLDQLVSIPQGEVCLALVVPPESEPGAILLLDVHEKLPQFMKLLGTGEDLIRQRGGSVALEKIEGTEIGVYTGPEGRSAFLCDREGTVLIATSREILAYTLKRWNGGRDRSLADSNSFNSLMSRCANTADDPPQITWFVDPVEAVRTFARGGVAATGLALLPVLGLDGVKGVAGSITLATGEFDNVQHVHLLLDQPRAGVVQLVAMKSGDTTPESWIPPDIITYSTVNWDLQLTYDKAAMLYDSLTSPGEFGLEVQARVGEPLGLDFAKELLPMLEGRFTFAQYVEKPVRINSIATLVGVRVKSGEEFAPLFEKVIDKYSENLVPTFHAGTPYWALKLPEEAQERIRERNERPDRATIRTPEPCLAIIGNYLVASDSRTALHTAIDTHNDPSRRLADELDYKLIASKIKRQVGGDAPGMVQFSRPEEGMRFWYEMALADNTQQMLARGAEGNPLLADVDRALKDHPLPPFSVLAKYLAPSGGMMVNDETGVHWMSFTLSRK
jgi:hypothetical protein